VIAAVLIAIVAISQQAWPLMALATLYAVLALYNAFEG
jgi:uncharacterized membrane protein